MKRYAIGLALALWVIFGAANTARAQADEHQGRLTEFDAPGATKVDSAACNTRTTSFCGTIGYGINDWGVAVGFYTDEHVVPHGFARFPDGQFVSFDAPGAGLGYDLNQGTVAYNINDFGVIVGQLQDSSYVFHGFLRYPDGGFTTFEVPSSGIGGGAGSGAGQGTVLLNINLEGETAGYYIDGSGSTHSFVRSPGGEITTFDAPDSIYTSPCMGATCLGPDGIVTGFFADATFVNRGFVRYPDGKIDVINGPGVDTGANIGTILAGRSLAGIVAGYVFNSPDNLSLSFLGYPGVGSFFSFQDPDAATGPSQGTAIFSINALGVVTGQYSNKKNFNIGFERFPDGRFFNFAGRNLGPGFYAGTRPATNNIEGVVVGQITDAAALNHGFIWIP